MGNAAASEAEEAGRPALRTAAVLVAVAGLAMLGSASIVLWSRPDLTDAQKWARAADLSLWVPLLAIAVLVASRPAAASGSRMLALALALLGCLNGVGFLVESLPGGGPSWLELAGAAIAWPAFAVFIRAAQEFPADLGIEDLRAAGRGRVRRWLFIPLRLLLKPWRVWAFTLLLVGLQAATRSAFGLPAELLVTALGGAYWSVQWRVGNPERRRRVLWILQSVIAYGVLTLVALALSALLASGVTASHRSWVAIPYNYVSSLVIAGCVAMAIFRAGAVHPDLVIRRTLIYGLAAALIMFGLEVALDYATEEMVERLAISDRLVSALFGAAAGLGFQPVADRIRRLLERLR